MPFIRTRRSHPRAVVSVDGFSLSSLAGKMVSSNGTNCFAAALPTKPLHRIATAIRREWRSDVTTRAKALVASDRDWDASSLTAAVANLGAGRDRSPLSG